MTNERRARGVAHAATVAIASAMVATLTVPAASATRTSATTAAVPILRVVAQNFNVFSSGTLRFAFVVDNPRLRARLLAPRPAQPN